MNRARTILIVGSRTGIGRDLAIHYLDRGHSVIGISRGATDLLHANYRHFTCDAGDDRQVRNTFAEMGAAEPTPDVLIYSAGLKVDGYVLLAGPRQVESMLRTNLLGAFLVTQQAVRLMKRKGFGRFVYFTSIAVPLGSAGSAMYGATKAGVEQMAFTLSREFPEENITFNCLGISVYPSAMVAGMDPKSLEQARKSLVRPEPLRVEEISAAVDFFSSDAARQLTGQTIYYGGVR